MIAHVGKNTISGKRLREIIEQIEDYRAQKKDISDLESALMAAAKSEGFQPKAIRVTVKLRAMKPHDREEAESLLDSYKHAVGLADEPPLFRLMAGMVDDVMSREALIEKFKELAPSDGDFIVRVGGDAVRIFRDREGNPQTEPYVEAKARSSASAPAARMPQRPRIEVPNVDEAGAREYGRQMYLDNKPIIENPFPFGDPRRAKCDEGYRSESGGDGMGPDEE